MKDLIITTSQALTPDLENTALKLSQELGVPYIIRNKKPFAQITNNPFILVVTCQKLILKTPSGDFFFHPNMAKLRIKHLREGKKDFMIEAAALKRGDSFIDCTLGLGSDALVASYVTGSEGEVVGIESIPVIALLTKVGLLQYSWHNELMRSIAKNIKVMRMDHLEFLRTLPNRSFDVVYFDPMFRIPISTSKGISPLREISDRSPINFAAIIEAKRIARKRVVFKETRYSPEFERLGFDHFIGGTYSDFGYGYISIKEEI